MWVRFCATKLKAPDIYGRDPNEPGAVNMVIPLCDRTHLRQGAYVEWGVQYIR